MRPLFHCETQEELNPFEQLCDDIKQGMIDAALRIVGCDPDDEDDDDDNDN